MKSRNQPSESVTPEIGVGTARNLPTPADKSVPGGKKPAEPIRKRPCVLWRSEWAAALAFCRYKCLSPLLATTATVAAHMQFCGEAGKKPATVRRYLATIAIATAHRVAKVLNPNDDVDVKMALKGI